MPTAKADPDFERALVFERSACEQLARRIEPLPYGFACLDERVPFVYFANCVWVPGAPDVGVDALVADADRLLAAFEHRWIIVEHEPLWRALEDRFGAAGWGSETLLWMVHRGGAHVLDGSRGVREVTRAEIHEAEDRFGATQPWGRRPEVRRQLIAHHGRLGDILSERYFAAFAGEQVAGYAKLRCRDGVAQVEDVAVLAEHRGRGHGRLVTAAATQAALEADPELLFIVADDHDWPKRLYERLGYVPVGRTRIYHRLPPGEAV